MRTLKWLLLALIVASLPGVVAAETYPSRPIKLVVPFPPGGPNDIIARVIGQRMSELLGQQIVIDNRGGAGGVVGTDAVAKAAPDGYTIGICSAGAIAISASLVEKVPYDSTKDLTPITLVATVPELLVVPESLPVKTFQELVAMAKAQPGKLNFASSGPGSMPHLAGELLKINAKIDIVHVPYRGAAPAVNDLLGGQVQMVFLDTPVLLPHIKSGKFRALAVAAKERAPSVPDVPTMGELGLASVDAENWYGMVGPANLPKDIVDKLNKAAADAMKSPEVIAKLSPQGAKLVGDSPEKFGAFIKSEIVKWGAVVKASGAKQSL
ncbi:MAG: tripartite tricarboxylate transporter substrate binding protein [Rhizobiales bacterium]|nr:tripartite tricarboxylate transporter substrate binding protein [Hyphomicrobiales bacterium]